MTVNLNEAALIGLDTRRSKIQRGSVRYPTHSDHGQCSFGTFPFAVLAEVHPHTVRCLFEGFDGAETFVDVYTRSAERGRDRRRNVFVLGWQDSWAGLEESDTRAKGIEYRGDLRPR